MLPTALFVLYVFLFQLEGVISRSTAECTDESYSWTPNVLGDNPCTVAADLQARCSGVLIDIPPLTPRSYYEGPSAATQNLCSCSNVVYSLISACGECQGGYFINWEEWIDDCAHTTNSFPAPIPYETIPEWAFLDVTASNNRFNSTLAKAKALEVLNHPISTSHPHPSAPTNPNIFTTMSTPIMTSIPSPFISASSVSPSSASSRPFRIGILVGWIVGGFVVLVLLVAFISWCVVRRRRARIAPSAAYRAQYGAVPVTITPRPQSYYGSSRVDSPEMTKASEAYGLNRTPTPVQLVLQPDTAKPKPPVFN